MGGSRLLGVANRLGKEDLSLLVGCTKPDRCTEQQKMTTADRYAEAPGGALSRGLDPGAGAS